MPNVSDTSVNKIIFSRLLPKTGQTIVYTPAPDYGDDGYYQTGWWKGKKSTNNKTRFLNKTCSGDDIIIDNTTKLIWASDANAAGCNNGNQIAWLGAINYANNLNFAGFTDWRIPNFYELLSICDYFLLNPSIKQPPFANTKNGYYWTSTTNIGNSVKAWFISFADCWNSRLDKINTYYIRCVRKGI